MPIDFLWKYSKVGHCGRLKSVRSRFDSECFHHFLLLVVQQFKCKEDMTGDWGHHSSIRVHDGNSFVEKYPDYRGDMSSTLVCCLLLYISGCRGVWFISSALGAEVTLVRIQSPRPFMQIGRDGVLYKAHNLVIGGFESPYLHLF